MKKIILTLVISVCSMQVGFSQNIDQATLTKIKVKLLNAEKLYEQGEYTAVLDKVREIEAITGGVKSAKIQNLKVKAYLGAGMYQQSKEELNTLYKMNPDDEVIEDIASYESRIEKGDADEKAKFKTIMASSTHDFENNGPLRVEINKKYGFIDKTGKVVIPLMYEFALPFSEGLARVELNGKKVYINKAGEIID